MARNFCGILDLHASVLAQPLQEMAQAMNFSQRYQIEYRGTSEFVAANLYSRKNQQHYSSGQALEKSIHIVSFSSLIRKESLIRQLDMPPGNYSDEYMIQRAYLKWGRSCVSHLEGDWAFALWDEQEQKLTLARNPHGEGTIYYRENGPRMYFASMPAALLAIGELPRKVNHSKLFQESLKLNGSSAETLYSDIFMLQPGHWAEYDRSGLKISQYWHLDVEQNLAVGSYERAFYEHCEESVRQVLQLSSSWHIALSGGKDSAALLMLAHRLAGVSKKLVAVHYSEQLPEGQQIIGVDDRGESRLVDLIVKRAGSVQLQSASCNESIHDFATGFVSNFGIPPFTINQKYVTAITRTIDMLGGQMAMNAQGGNETFSYKGMAPYFSIDQLINDKLLGYQPTVRDYLLATMGSVREHVKKQLRRKLVRYFVKKHTALSEDFVHSVNGYELFEDYLFSGQEYGQSPSSRHYRKKLRPGTHERRGGWNMIGSLYDVQYADPSLDLSLIQFIASCPNSVFNNGKESKVLYKEAFADILPPEVISQRAKWTNMTQLMTQYKEGIEAIMGQFDEGNNLSHALGRSRIERFNHQLISRPADIHYFNQLRQWIGGMLLSLYIRI